MVPVSDSSTRVVGALLTSPALLGPGAAPASGSGAQARNGVTREPKSCGHCVSRLHVHCRGSGIAWINFAVSWVARSVFSPRPCEPASELHTSLVSTMDGGEAQVVKRATPPPGALAESARWLQPVAGPASIPEEEGGNASSSVHSPTARSLRRLTPPPGDLGASIAIAQ